eukprot:scaffold206613_cov26-Tisochrysis_lutea.AAC.6
MPQHARARRPSQWLLSRQRRQKRQLKEPESRERQERQERRVAVVARPACAVALLAQAGDRATASATTGLEQCKTAGWGPARRVSQIGLREGLAPCSQSRPRTTSVSRPRPTKGHALWCPLSPCRPRPKGRN